jgi:hypothetical protein
LLVDRYVVVEPAQGGEVLRIMAPASGSVNNVVWFEPIPAGAARNGAAAVTSRHKAAYRWRDRTRRPRGDDRFAVLEADDLHTARAQQFFKHGWSDSGSVFDPDPGFAARAVGLVEVDKDRH